MNNDCTVVDREFVFCIFCSSILIIYGGCFVVRNALMRVRSGIYRAARYLNSFVIVPVSLAGVVPRPSCCSLVS